jgi:hypothetical protein
MKRFLSVLVTTSLAFVALPGISLAQDEDDPAVPVELYVCSYNEGMGSDDIDAATDAWNKWADDEGVRDYTAWTLTKSYYSPVQDFDFIWLGVASSATAMGRTDDKYRATGGGADAEWEKAATCNVHTRFASVQFKAPAQRDEPLSNVVLAFSDCTIAEGKNFGDDVAPAISRWTESRTDQGSATGHWVLFSTYGGGGEEFDFKYVTAYQNHEAMGADWDSYDGKLAGELFDGVLDCDSSRVYDATNRRRAETD